jgi:DNA-binding transcriptional MerR regulator
VWLRHISIVADSLSTTFILKLKNEFVSKIDKKYYTIGEVAQSFGVATSLIRYWEKRFKQLHPQKSQQGVRRYTVSDLEQFRAIYQLVKQQGYTIKGAQEALKVTIPTSPKNYKALIENLKEIREFMHILYENV